MTKKHSTKRAFISSLLMLSLCFTMFVGTTFAWYTDSVTSSGNKIIAGTLDIELWKYDGTAYVDISNSSAPIFKSSNIAQNSTETLWEPGKTQIAYLMIKNAGKLHLKYQVALDVYNVSKDLYKAMKYKIIPDAKNGELNTWSWTTLGGLEAVSLAGTVIPDNGSYSFLTSSVDVDMAPGDIHYFALAIHMEEEAGNEYMNGEVDFDLKVLATQNTVEYDSFNNQYDKDAVYPVISIGSVTMKSAPSESDALIINTNGEVTSASVPGTAAKEYFESKATGTDNEVTLNLNVAKTGEVETETGTSVALEIDMSALITVDGATSTENITTLTDYVTINYDLGEGLSDVTVTHNGNAMEVLAAVDATPTNANGGYFYNSTSGILTIKTKSFSPFAVTYTNLVRTLDELKESLSTKGKAVLGNDITVPSGDYVSLDGNLINGNGFSLIHANNGRGGVIINPTGGTVKNLTIAGSDTSSSFSVGSIQFHSTKLTEDLYLENVVIKKSSQSLDIDADGHSVYVEDSTISGIIQIANAKEIVFENCHFNLDINFSFIKETLILLMGDMTFVNCHFEENVNFYLDTATRWHGTITFNGCTYGNNGVEDRPFEKTAGFFSWWMNPINVVNHKGTFGDGKPANIAFTCIVDDTVIWEAQQ